MKHLALIFLLLGSVVVFFTGCSNLKPTTESPRYFLLPEPGAQIPDNGSSTNSAQPPAQSPSGATPIMAVAPIKLPDYLAKKSVAMRKSASEIEYLESALWAERLDEGFLRVLIASLAHRLPGHTVRRSASRKTDGLELQVTVVQFDVNATGEGVLTADWRIVSPTGEKPIGAGQFHTSRKGPDPKRDPAGTVSTLAALIDDFSGTVSKAIR